MHYWAFYAISKGGFFEIAFVSTHMYLPRFEAIAYVLPQFDAVTHVMIRVFSALLLVLTFKSLLKVYYRSVFVESSKAFNTLSKILLWIKPSYFSAWFVTVFGK